MERRIHFVARYSERGRDKMKWLELSVATSHEAMELIASVMEELGASGVVMEDPQLVNEYLRAGIWDCTDIPEQQETAVVTVKAYLPLDEALAEKRRLLSVRLAELSARGVNIEPAAVSEQTVADEDWAESWKKYFHVEKVGSRIVIQPSWESYEPQPQEVVLRLDPGTAFGTGTHPTTIMCLQALERLVRPGMKIFDVGTGSGVLAMAAMKLGAGQVTAVDSDGAALQVARENIGQNGLADAITVKESDLMAQVEGRADLVTANIIADVIIRLFADIDAHLEPGGVLLASGIIADRAADVKEAAKAHGFAVVEERAEKEWRFMVFRREREG